LLSVSEQATKKIIAVAIVIPFLKLFKEYNVYFTLKVVTHNGAELAAVAAVSVSVVWFIGVR